MIGIKEAVPHEVSVEVRNAILHIGAWQIGPPSQIEGQDFEDITTFAWGGKANNKLLVDLVLDPYSEYVEQVPDDRRVTEAEFLDARELVLNAYDMLLSRFDDERVTVWGVPTGGQTYALERARRRKLDVVMLEKDDTRPGRKTYKLASMADLAKLAEAECMIGSEDAGSHAASPYGAFIRSNHNGLALLKRKTVAMQYVWVRGPLTKLIGLDTPIPIQTIVHEPIPEQIKREDKFFKTFGRLAVEVQAKH